MNTAQKAIRKKNPSWVFPDFDVKKFSNKQNKYAICVFVINEGSKIQKQLEKMAPYSTMIDIIIADGGSEDGSLEEKFLIKNKVRALITKKGQGKLSAQMRMAFAWCLNENYEGIVIVDGNNKDDVSAIPKFIAALDQGYDHIQGSRYIEGGQAINTPLERHLAVKIIHSPLISIASRKRHTDTTNGFRAYSTKLLTDSDIHIFREVFDAYELHYYLAVESSRRPNYKLTEVPVTRSYPKKGKTPTKISPIKGNLMVLKTLIDASLRRHKL